MTSAGWQVGMSESVAVLRRASRTFSTGALKRLLSKKTRAQQISYIASVARELRLHRDGFLVEDYYAEAFAILRRRYQSEIVYKEAISNWWMNRSGNRASPGLLFEVRSGTSKLDVLCLGASAAAAFEIKTEYDQTRRLSSQLLNYRKRFPLVSVVVSGEANQRSIDSLPKAVGIFAVTARGGLRLVRAPTADYSCIDPAASVGLLRREEALLLARRFGIDLSDVPNTLFQSRLREKVSTIPPRDLAFEVSSRLRRRSTSVGMGDLRALPIGLRAAVAGCELGMRDLSELRSLLKMGL